jgi:hypothetical protein
MALSCMIDKVQAGSALALSPYFKLTVYNYKYIKNHGY